MNNRRNPGCLTMIMWALLILIAVLAVAILIQQNRPREQEDRTVYQIKTEILLPDVTPVPAPTAWVRYPVPLEDSLQRYIWEVCKEYGVPAELVLAIMEPESGYDPSAIGDSGQSYGLMQMWASEHTDRCIRLNCYNLLDERQSVLAGVDFLAELWASYGNWEQALSFYHGEGGETPCDYANDILAKAEILEESASIETY